MAKAKKTLLLLILLSVLTISVYFLYDRYGKENLYFHSSVGDSILTEYNFNDSCHKYGFSISDLYWNTIYCPPANLRDNPKTFEEHEELITKELDERKIRVWLLNLIDDLDDKDPSMWVQTMLNPTEKALYDSSHHYSFQYVGDQWRTWKAHTLTGIERERREKLLAAVKNDPIIAYAPFNVKERVYKHVADILDPVDFSSDFNEAGDPFRPSLITLLEGLQWTKIPALKEPLMKELSEAEKDALNASLSEWNAYFRKNAPVRRYQGQPHDLYSKILSDFPGARIGAKHSN